LDSRAFPIKDEKGNVISVIVIVSDVTEKTTLQAEAMRASHLASLGELAAGVAHEINNPINGIINYAQLILNKMTPGTREQDISRRIIKEGDRIAGIVKSLLSFARERKEELTQVNLQMILVEAITLTEAQIRKDGIVLSIEIPQNLPMISANAQQIQQVFLNVISNARYALNQKYPGTDLSKKLTITAKETRVNETRQVRLAFHDLGTGISSDLQDKVMDPFFSTKPSGQGTGLGLSISHGIVKNHGGKLTLESVEGEYTKVIIDLPVREKNGD
jgi:signal transduction histidine kinase